MKIAALAGLRPRQHHFHVSWCPRGDMLTNRHPLERMCFLVRPLAVQGVSWLIPLSGRLGGFNFASATTCLAFPGSVAESTAPARVRISPCTSAVGISARTRAVRTSLVGHCSLLIKLSGFPAGQRNMNWPSPRTPARHRQQPQAWPASPEWVLQSGFQRTRLSRTHWL